MAKSSERARKAILEVVDNQLRDLNPPAAKETFDRLVVEGFAQDEARRLIGCLVASEIFGALTRLQPYDEERYVTALKNLPELPE